MYVNFLTTYSDKKSCHTSTTLQTSIGRFVSDSWASCLALLGYNTPRLTQLPGQTYPASKKFVIWQVTTIDPVNVANMM